MGIVNEYLFSQKQPVNLNQAVKDLKSISCCIFVTVELLKERCNNLKIEYYE